MIFTAATEYGIRALAELSARGAPGQFVLLDQIISGTDLPRDFVAKIFQKLVHGEVLESAKGRGGGFRLARSPHDVTLMQIVSAIESCEGLDRCVVGLERCNDQMPCPQHDLYKPIRQRLKDFLNTTTLADLAASLRAKAAWKRANPAVAATGSASAR